MLVLLAVDVILCTSASRFLAGSWPTCHAPSRHVTGFAGLDNKYAAVEQALSHVPSSLWLGLIPSVCHGGYSTGALAPVRACMTRCSSALGCRTFHALDIALPAAPPVA
ncbi:hypothetical protein PENSPDRAFT_671857 [Peniophora sp. CONT]|nr:hypothetical protein PENSPDRAFT_671857 [Peniophora sp. CONT]